jgi:hypothetical protein
MYLHPRYRVRRARDHQIGASGLGLRCNFLDSSAHCQPTAHPRLGLRAEGTIGVLQWESSSQSPRLPPFARMYSVWNLQLRSAFSAGRRAVSGCDGQRAPPWCRDRGWKGTPLARKPVRRVQRMRCGSAPDDGHFAALEVAVWGRFSAAVCRAPTSGLMVGSSGLRKVRSGVKALREALNTGKKAGFSIHRHAVHVHSV